MIRFFSSAASAGRFVSDVKFREIVQTDAAEVFSVASTAIDGDMAVSDIDPAFAFGVDREGRNVPRDEVFIGVIALFIIGLRIERLDGVVVVERLFG